MEQQDEWMIIKSFQGELLFLWDVTFIHSKQKQSNEL